MTTDIDTIHVLCVDDDPDYLELIETYLQEDDDLTVSTVPSAAEARTFIDEHAGAVDCVVSDYDMSGETGLDLLRTVRDEYGDLPFILFTGKGSEAIAADAVQAGVDNYLQKGGPETHDLLADQITQRVKPHDTDRINSSRSSNSSELSKRVFRLMYPAVVGPSAMSVSKTLMAVLAVALVAGSGAAAAGVAQTDAGTSSASTSVSDLEMETALENETITVTVTDDGAPVEDASITVEGDEEVTVTTDANGTATVDRSALTEANESLEALEISYESDYAEGELEYVVSDGSLTLVEEEYEYEVADDADDEAESDEAEADDEAEDDERDEAEDDSDDEEETDDEEEEADDDADDAEEDDEDDAEDDS